MDQFLSWIKILLGLGACVYLVIFVLDVRNRGLEAVLPRQQEQPFSRTRMMSPTTGIIKKSE